LGGINLLFSLGNASTGEILLILGGVLGFVHWLPNLIIRYKKAIREPTTEREIEGDDAVPDDSEIRNRETPDYSEEIRREIYKK